MRARLRFTIYDEHKRLIIKLHVLSRAAGVSLDLDASLTALTTVGALRPALVSEIADTVPKATEKKRENTALSFLELSGSTNAREALLFTANGMIITTMLGIMRDQTLDSLFAPALEALSRLSREAQQQSGFDAILEEEALHAVESLMEVPDVCAMSCILDKFASIALILGSKLTQLEPRLVDYICVRWDLLNGQYQLAALRWTQWHAPDAFKPFALRLSNVLVAEVKKASDANALTIFEIFISVLAPHIDATGHMIYPLLLEWIQAQTPETPRATETIAQLRRFFKNGPAPLFASQVVRAMISCVAANPALVTPALETLEEISRLLGPQFLAYEAALQRSFNGLLSPDRVSVLFQTEPSAQSESRHISRPALHGAQISQKLPTISLWVLGMSLVKRAGRRNSPLTSSKPPNPARFVIAGIFLNALRWFAMFYSRPVSH
jgi:hypothetical protein